MTNFRSSVFSFLRLGEASWVLAGAAAILIPEEQILLYWLHFSLGKTVTGRKVVVFFLTFFFLTAEV